MHWHIARIGEMRDARKILIGKPKEKIPLGRPRLRWEDNIRIVFREVGWEAVNWIHLT
jgi:hypothetical protein